MHDSEPVLGSLSGAHCVKNNLCLVHSRLGRVGRDKTKKPTVDTHTGVDAKSKTKYTKNPHGPKVKSLVRLVPCPLVGAGPKTALLYPEQGLCTGQSHKFAL